MSAGDVVKREANRSKRMGERGLWSIQLEEVDDGNSLGGNSDLLSDSRRSTTLKGGEIREAGKGRQ